ncbi:hypothetical protein Vadar_001591 [Vaccinium darrowii]|uniref:Uncharacterized protein n=1 Tax=Vaccinium darrowii TaxID=229202 RepID=A0ACB7XMG7_9ERIC|nr:hypothetical protein Vadar_001591 [Vaccinium darrowii]
MKRSRTPLKKKQNDRTHHNLHTNLHSHGNSEQNTHLYNLQFQEEGHSAAEDEDNQSGEDYSEKQLVVYDPAASGTTTGSPTKTLLRLLLPLNDKVQWTSRDVAGSKPPTSLLFERFTGPFNR